MKRLFFAATAILLAFASHAQDTQKLGYADTDYILSQMPEAKKVETDLQAHGAQLEATLKAKAQDYEKKLADYQANYTKWVDAIVKDKQAELQALQQAFTKFQQDAESSFAKKQQDLMTPLYDKVGTAIADVAKENGYSFIITLNAAGGSGSVLLYKDPQFDISNLVLKKMGVTPTPVTNTQQKPQPK